MNGKKEERKEWRVVWQQRGKQNIRIYQDNNNRLGEGGQQEEESVPLLEEEEDGSLPQSRYKYKWAGRTVTVGISQTITLLSTYVIYT